jgi:hypothetical protein
MFSSRAKDRFYHFELFGGDLFELTEEEKQELAVFTSVISELQRRKLAKLREFARQKGVAALELKDLKSGCGEPFIEEKCHSNYQRAAAKGKAGSPSIEFAYRCAWKRELFPGSENTCGWVRGEPREEGYDNLGLLSGSAGRRFYCKICDKMLGEFQEVVSCF